MISKGIKNSCEANPNESSSEKYSQLVDFNDNKIPGRLMGLKAANHRQALERCHPGK